MMLRAKLSSAAWANVVGGHQLRLCAKSGVFGDLPLAHGSRVAFTSANPRAESCRPKSPVEVNAPFTDDDLMSAKPDPKPRKANPKQTRKRGRPAGSIRILTAEERSLVLSAIENGASDHAAARMIEMDARTFRRHRQIAESRDPAHPTTPYLTQLFTEIDAAKARARVRRELEVAARFPKDWLRHQAPSEPGLPGWTAPVPEETDEAATPIYAPTPQEMSETMRILIQSGAVPNPFAKD